MSAILHIEQVEEWIRDCNEDGIIAIDVSDFGDLLYYLEEQRAKENKPRAGGYHTGDPSTSRRAATNPASMVRWHSQRHHLLRAFRYENLTYEEAGDLAGVTDYNQHRRCSELRAMGLIESTDQTRKNASSGRDAMVCKIKALGLEVLAEMTRSHLARTNQAVMG